MSFMIIITGASDGLGLQVAKTYKEAGKTVVNISRRECPYAEVNICVSLDDAKSFELIKSQIEKINEPIEAIINSIGIFSNEGFGEMTEEKVDKVFAVNVKAPMMLISELIERIKKDEADILNVISTAGIKGKDNVPVYTASKWAERGFTKSLQELLKETKCRVISFCPGKIYTKFAEKDIGYDVSSPDSMHTEDLAIFIKQILDLPKNVEVSEVILNTK